MRSVFDGILDLSRHTRSIILERSPFGLRVFDLPHIVFGRFSPKIEAFSRRFSGLPANPRILCVWFSYSSIDLLSWLSVFTTGIFRANPNSHSRRNVLYVRRYYTYIRIRIFMRFYICSRHGGQSRGRPRLLDGRAHEEKSP